jgi:transposase
MEACGGANYWYRKFKAMGHEVKLISPQFVTDLNLFVLNVKQKGNIHPSGVS